jgi:hypothetical protein
MTASTFRRLIAVVALGIFLGMPLTSMAGPRVTAPRSESREITPAPFGWLWALLTGNWTKEGCLIDPNGCLGNPKAPDAGCLIDPNGSCTPQITPKNGCSVDPYGRCIPGT